MRGTEAAEARLKCWDISLKKVYIRTLVPKVCIPASRYLYKLLHTHVSFPVADLGRLRTQYTDTEGEAPHSLGAILY